MATTSLDGAPTVHVLTLEGARLAVSKVRHPRSGVPCLSFTDREGRRVALVPREAVTSLRQRVWQLSAKDGASYTLGPVDIAVLRNLAAV